jgi:hypothetical protein
LCPVQAIIKPQGALTRYEAVPHRLEDLDQSLKFIALQKILSLPDLLLEVRYDLVAGAWDDEDIVIVSKTRP